MLIHFHEIFISPPKYSFAILTTKNSISYDTSMNRSAKSCVCLPGKKRKGYLGSKVIISCRIMDGTFILVSGCLLEVCGRLEVHCSSFASLLGHTSFVVGNGERIHFWKIGGKIALFLFVFPGCICY